MIRAEAVLLLAAFAVAAPADHPGRAAATRIVLDEGLDHFTGLAPESDARAAWMVGGCEGRGPWVGSLLACSAAVPRWSVHPTFALDLGDGEADNASGDAAPGLAGFRVGASGALEVGQMVLRASPTVGLDMGEPMLSVPELWMGHDSGHRWLGLGTQDRWMGPGRHGTLLLSNNAVAPWMGNAGLDGHLPGRLGVLGRFRAELGLGLLTEPRPDVSNPGLLLMDLRWMPHPVIEIGVNRLAIFGGEGRPAVDVGQLLVPSEPHIYDDPDQILPDQDELATVNVRVNAPLHRWFGGMLGHATGWWEYGGEDMVMRDVGGIEIPSLAGIGNLYGGEVAVGPVVLTGEYSRLMDDVFRWYVGHRVYHDGFTQNGRSMGHFGGPDSETAWGSVAVWGDSWRVRASADYVRRVGVIESRGDDVFALPTVEERMRGSLGGDLLWRGSWVTASYSLADVKGEDFIAGNDGVEHRVMLGVNVGGP